MLTDHLGSVMSSGAYSFMPGTKHLLPNHAWVDLSIYVMSVCLTGVISVNIQDLSVIISQLEKSGWIQQLRRITSCCLHPAQYFLIHHSVRHAWGITLSDSPPDNRLGLPTASVSPQVNSRSLADLGPRRQAQPAGGPDFPQPVKLTWPERTGPTALAYLPPHSSLGSEPLYKVRPQ